MGMEKRLQLHPEGVICLKEVKFLKLDFFWVSILA